MSFAAVLLAGGASVRMGRDKSGLEWSGETLLAHQAGTLRRIGAEPLLLSCRREQARHLEGFQVVTDTLVGAGPASALADVWRETRAQVLVVLAVDLPRMPDEYLHEMAVGALQQERSVVPMLGGHYEPLAAAWHRSSLVELAGASGRSLQVICSNLVRMELLTVRAVSDSEAPLFENVNTPADYDRARGGNRPSS